MRNRSNPADPAAPTAPTCWEREGPSACLRVEFPNGESHLFSYQHFVTATFTRDDAGAETARIVFSTHSLEVEGRGLRELLLGLQEFAVKWMRPAPERYQTLPAGSDGIISAIRIVDAE
jgi:hypothetical protein